MSPPGDVPGDMRGLPFDELGVDALLDGRVAEDDAPPGFQDVARLVLAARSPAIPDELVGEEHVVAALAAAAEATVTGATGRPASDHGDGGRRRMLGKILTAKMAAAAAVAVLGGGVAAAATGSLPTSLQSSVSHGLSTLGIGVPDPANNPPDLVGGTAETLAGTSSAGTATSSTTPPSTTTGTTTTGTTTTGTTTPGSSTAPAWAVGPSATGPALHGLCTAYAASSGGQAARHSVAFRNLTEAATAKKESVAQYCTAALHPSTTGTAGTTGTGTTTTGTTATQGPPVMPSVQGPPVSPSGTSSGNQPATHGHSTGQGRSHGGAGGSGGAGGGHGHSGGGHG